MKAHININVPTVDLHKQYHLLKKEIDTAIKMVIEKATFIDGMYVEKFEEEIASYLGVKYAVAVNSGTDALYLSLWALSIKDQDEVITTPFTFIATVSVIRLLRARPVFVDIDPETFNLDPHLIERKITKKTRAIIPVHLLGQSANMDTLLQIAKNYNIPIVEDACQAIGAKYNNKKVGTFGKTGCFSFYPSKNLGGFGDGGMIVTDDVSLAEKLRLLRSHGSFKKNDAKILGVNSRLDALQANILSIKLKYLDQWNEKRRKIAYRYNKKLRDLAFIKTPFEDPVSYHVYHQYAIKVKKVRDKLQKHLLKNGVETIVYYPTPLHLLEAMENLGYKKGDFPNAEEISRQVLSLPIFPEMSSEQIEKVTESIINFD